MRKTAEQSWLARLTSRIKMGQLKQATSMRTLMATRPRMQKQLPGVRKSVSSATLIRRGQKLTRYTVAKKAAAMESLLALEKRFATLRDRSVAQFVFAIHALTVTGFMTNE